MRHRPDADGASRGAVKAEPHLPVLPRPGGADLGRVAQLVTRYGVASHAVPMEAPNDGRRRMRRWVVAVALLGLCWSCASSGQAWSAAATLQAAATATAHATSFTIVLEGVEVTYQAPDRVEQVEHGQASASSSSSGGTASTSGPYAETITKVFIGDHYYEGDSPTGQTPTFSVSQRCASDTNAAQYVLGILGAMATSGDIRASGGGFSFQIPKGSAVSFPLSGTATVAAGYVKTINLNPGAGAAPAISIGSIDAAPPVTAPPLATPATMSCSDNATGAGTVPASTSLLPTGR